MGLGPVLLRVAQGLLRTRGLGAPRPQAGRLLQGILVLKPCKRHRSSALNGRRSQQPLGAPF